MAWCRIKKGLPYTFQVFVFFSPKQFEKEIEIDEKEFLFKLKICTNSGRVFTGPFINEVVGEYEVPERELKKMITMVNETPGLIIYGFEYTITDDLNGLWKYYGKPGDSPMPYIDKEELLAQ